MLTSLLEELPPGDRDRLLALGRVEDARAGQEVTRQGCLGNCLYVVEAGELEVVRRVPGDEEESLDVAPAGTLVGELAVLDRRPRSASLRARQDARLRVIDLRSFESLTLDGGACGHRILMAVAVSLHHRLTVARAGVAARFQDASTDLGATRTRPCMPEWRAARAGMAGILARLPVFSGLDRGEIQALAEQMGEATVARGAEFALAACSQPSATFLLRGAVSPCLAAADGMAIDLPVVAPGGFVDYACVLDRGDDKPFWRARSPAMLARFPARVFAADSPLGARLLYALCKDLAIAIRSTTGLAMHLGMSWDQSATAASLAAAAVSCNRKV